MNSPHPALAVLDEFELTTPEKYTEFENILHSSPDYDAVEILTTSIKYPNGMAVKTMEDAGYAFKQEGVVQIVQNPTRNYISGPLLIQQNPANYLIVLIAKL